MDDSIQNEAINESDTKLSGNITDAENLDKAISASIELIHEPSKEETTEKQDYVPEVTPALLDKRKVHGWRQYLGVIYVICAINMSAIGANILKLLLLRHIHPITLCLYSFPTGILLAIPSILHRHIVQKKPVMENVFPLNQHKIVIFFMWLRATITILIMFTFLWSIEYIMVSESRTIFSASVIFVNIFGSIFFKEKFGVVTAIVSVIALGGIVVMSKPPFLTGKSRFDTNTLIGISIALCCMLFSTVNMLVLRFLNNVYHGVLNMSLFAYAFISTLPFAIGFKKMIIPKCTIWDILGIFLYGVISSLTNTFLTLGLQNEKVGVVALIRTCELIFTFIWQMVLLKKYPGWISYLGAVLVLIGVFLVGLKKWIEGKEEDSTIRKRFQWLLY